MKELTIKQKAKAYDEAIEKLKNMMPNWELLSYNGKTFLQDLIYIFPELKESEDEKIRKRIIQALHGDVLDMEETTKAIAWLEKQGKLVAYYEDKLDRCACENFNKGYKKALEKQGEQKPADKVEPKFEVDSNEDGLIADTIRYKNEQKTAWSEEDEELYREALVAFASLYNEVDPVADWGKLYSWLKSLRPQNWTKEDKERYISCLQRLGTGNPKQPETINSKWFKEHVYPQNTWKPSDEQMEAILNVMHPDEPYYNELNSLYKQLKKIKRLSYEIRI